MGGAMGGGNGWAMGQNRPYSTEQLRGRAAARPDVQVLLSALQSQTLLGSVSPGSWRR